MSTISQNVLKSSVIQLCVLSYFFCWVNAQYRDVINCNSTRDSICVNEPCVGKTCGGRCNGNSDCLTHKVCQPAAGGNLCGEPGLKTSCLDDSSCVSGRVCHKNVCQLVQKGGNCTTTADCFLDQVCKEKVCADVSAHTLFWIVLAIVVCVIILVAFIIVLC